MKATQLLHNMGQSIWLDNITRDLLDNGTLNTRAAEGRQESLRPPTAPGANGPCHS